MLSNRYGASGASGALHHPDKIPPIPTHGASHEQVTNPLAPPFIVRVLRILRILRILRKVRVHRPAIRAAHSFPSIPSTRSTPIRRPFKKNQKIFKKPLDISKKCAFSLESTKKSKKIQKFFISSLDVSRYVMYITGITSKRAGCPERKNK